MSQQSIGANPRGCLGKLAGRIMNLLHDKQYKDIIVKIGKTQNRSKITIIDIGCGGGIAIKHFAEVFPEAHILGIDISQDMVNLACAVNRKVISKGRVSISSGNVEEMNIECKSINLITVFDNINFWSNYGKAFSEIKRILKHEGHLFIINEYPEKGTKWYEFVKFKDLDDYRYLLENNGFALVNHEMQGHTIIIEAAPNL